MDWKSLLMEILYVVLVVILPIITKSIVKWLGSKIDEIQVGIESCLVNDYIDYAQTAISQAVLTISQTYTDSLKKAGKFNKEAQETAKSKAVELAKQMITADVKEAVEKVYGDFTVYLDSAIETLVRDTKLQVETDPIQQLYINTVEETGNGGGIVHE